MAAKKDTAEQKDGVLQNGPAEEKDTVVRTGTDEQSDASGQADTSEQVGNGEQNDATQQKRTLVRVLVAFPFEGKDYAANDLVEFPAESVESMKKSGQVDDSEGAIAYCAETLGKKPVVHVPESAEQEPQGEAK